MRNRHMGSIALLALGLTLTVGINGCSESTGSTQPATSGGVIAGMTFTLRGATFTNVSSALPTSDMSFTAPVLSKNRDPSSTVPATISISAAEPFETVFIQPRGTDGYLRVTLPARTSLTGIDVRYNSSNTPPGNLTISVGSGTRASRQTSLALITITN